MGGVPTFSIKSLGRQVILCSLWRPETTLTLRLLFRISFLSDQVRFKKGAFLCLHLLPLPSYGTFCSTNDRISLYLLIYYYFKLIFSHHHLSPPCLLPPLLFPTMTTLLSISVSSFYLFISPFFFFLLFLLSFIFSTALSLGITFIMYIKSM